VIVLLDTPPKLGVTGCQPELGTEVGQLLTPLTRYRLQNAALPWAIDNGAYAGFREKEFLALLKREEHHKHNCLFVCAPDVVADFDATLTLFNEWKNRLDGWNLAFVLQDGLQISRVPWNDIAAVFVGGSNKFKGSFVLLECLKIARWMDKWIHIGRVNTPNRYKFFEGIADSCDGTGLSRYTHMREAIAKRHNQRGLFT
jgi:hypothetical protein